MEPRRLARAAGAASISMGPTGRLVGCRETPSPFSDCPSTPPGRHQGGLATSCPPAPSRRRQRRSGTSSGAPTGRWPRSTPRTRSCATRPKALSPRSGGAPRHGPFGVRAGARRALARPAPVVYRAPSDRPAVGLRGRQFWPAGHGPHRHERPAPAAQLDAAAAGSQSTPRVAAAAAFGREGREPPRASTPTGPTHRRPVRRWRRTCRPWPRPGHSLEFGKFAGLTLGEVAVIEPSYIEWIVRTIDRDPRSAWPRESSAPPGYGPVRRPRLDTIVQRG
jgi:hypothetical protein